MAFNGKRLDLRIIAVVAAVALAAAFLPNETCGPSRAGVEVSCGAGKCACCNAAHQETCGTNSGASDVAPVHMCVCGQDRTVPADGALDALPVRLEHKPYPAVVPWGLPMSHRIPPCGDDTVVPRRETLAADSSPPHYLSACSLLI
jgi:hypothetical protein